MKNGGLVFRVVIVKFVCLFPPEWRFLKHGTASVSYSDQSLSLTITGTGVQYYPLIILLTIGLDEKITKLPFVILLEHPGLYNLVYKLIFVW